jgi:hypothetical protein
MVRRGSRVWRHAGTRPGAVLLLALTCTGCDLTEITIAEPADLVVVELVLRTDALLQVALLHRTFARGRSDVDDASVFITDPDGRSVQLSLVADSVCIDTSPVPQTVSCYASAAGDLPVEPGRRYRADVTAGPDVRLSAVTTVPGTFTIVNPTARTCELEADTPFEVVWTSTPTAWAYLAEAEFYGLRAALQQRNIDVPADPLRLVGLAIGAADTTLLFPRDFGLFSRFDPDLTETLIAIQNGVPANVMTDMVIVAADRNYVNWVRGGNFNPSGAVRVPSFTGTGGTGVFGSLTSRPVRFVTSPGTGLPGC